MNGCALRKARKWTLRELSRRTGIAVSYLSALEWNEGGNRNPTASVLVSLADALEVSIDELCGRFPPTANGWVWMSEHQWNEIKDSAYGLRALMEDAEKVPTGRRVPKPEPEIERLGKATVEETAQAG